MKSDQGLFQLGFEDHHAVLGLPISAEAGVVRKRYLTIARKLHPDSLSATSGADAQRASELLSKWVNPAYEVLNQEKTFTEHQLLLKLKGQALRQASQPPSVSTEAAQALLKAPQVDLAYRQAVNTLAANQYEQLDQVPALVGQMSELNLVYLYRTGAGEGATPSVGTPPGQASPAAAASASPTTPRRPSQAAILDGYINRAQEFERDRDYSRAVLEMREALKTYPTNARCHSYLASLYLKAGQTTMARIHTKRALDLQPDDETALAVQSRLEKSAPNSGPSGRSDKTTDKSSGGFFGLFGGKKK